MDYDLFNCYIINESIELDVCWMQIITELFRWFLIWVFLFSSLFGFIYSAQILAFACIFSLKSISGVEDPVSLIIRLIQNNLVGGPVVHQVTEWDFDPDVALRRRELYEHVNGYRGEKLIERIGLGTDGLHNVRLAIQRERDEGLLGGTIHKIKHGNNIVEY